VFVKASKKWLTIAKALACCTTELITAVKSILIQAPESDPYRSYIVQVEHGQTIVDRIKYLPSFQV